MAPFEPPDIERMVGVDLGKAIASPAEEEQLS